MIDPDENLDVGRRVADYPPNYFYTARRVLVGLLFVVAGLIVLLIGLKVVPLPVREGIWQTVAAYVMSGILLASGVFLAIDALRSTGPRILVYDRGFVAGRDVFLWDRIDAFYQLVATLNFSGVPVSLTEYFVHRDDGRVVRFTRGVRRAGALAALIQERINPRLLAAARTELAAGQPVRFGDASVDADGLSFSDVMSGRTRRVSWNEVRGVDADGMQVRVRRVGESRLARLAGAGGSIATRKIANVGVFLALTAEILDDRRSG